MPTTMRSRLRSGASRKLTIVLTVVVVCSAAAIRQTAAGEADLLVSSAISDNVLRYDGETGAFVGVFASGSGLDLPTFLLFIPEPATFCLLALGGLLAMRRRG